MKSGAVPEIGATSLPGFAGLKNNFAILAKWRRINRRGTRIMTPLERAEVLYRELVVHYHEAQDAEVRAATKLLLVAIAELKRHEGVGWAALVYDYVAIADRDPERFNRILSANRSDVSASPNADGSFLG